MPHGNAQRKPLIGESFEEESYLLVLDRHYPEIKSWCPGCKMKFAGAIPASYFITSGDSIAKAEKLLADLYRMVGQTQKLIGLFKRARGEAPYLEVTSEDGVMQCVRRYKRDPASRPRIAPAHKPPLSQK